MKQKCVKYLIIIFCLTFTFFTEGFILNNSFCTSLNNPYEYLQDTTLLEVVNADYIAFRQEVEICASEVEKENKREVSFITYLIDPLDSYFCLLPNEDSYIRGKKLLSSLKRDGIIEVALNGRHLFTGRPGSSDWETRKAELKERIANSINNCFYKEWFSIKNSSLEKVNSNYKLKIELKADEDLKEKKLSETKILIFLVIDELKSKNIPMPHKNVAYKFIPVKGFENEEFDGTGNSLCKIINKDSISKEDIIEIESSEFNIDSNISTNWSIVVFIENDKRREILFTRKFKLNEN